MTMQSRASLPRDEAGPAGHGPRSSPEQPWRSGAEQSGQSPGPGWLLGRGRQRPRKTASPPHVHSPSSKQSCGACAQPRSARAIAAQVAAAGQHQNRGHSRTNNGPAAHPGPSACAGRAEGLASRRCGTARGQVKLAPAPSQPAPPGEAGGRAECPPPPPRTRSRPGAQRRRNRRLHLLGLPWGRRPARRLRFINECRGGN